MAGGWTIVRIVVATIAGRPSVRGSSRCAEHRHGRVLACASQTPRLAQAIGAPHKTPPAGQDDESRRKLDIKVSTAWWLCQEQVSRARQSKPSGGASRPRASTMTWFRAWV